MDALSWFSSKQVDVDVKDVLQDPEAMKRMKELTGQTLTPTFKHGDFVVPDFSTAELEAALRKRPEIQKELGIDLD